MERACVNCACQGYGAVGERPAAPADRPPAAPARRGADDAKQETSRGFLKQHYYLLAALLAAVCALSLAGAVLVCSTNVFLEQFSAVLRNNSAAFRLWSRPPLQPAVKVHLYNYTNWDRFKEGRDGKLHVEEVGPYVYQQDMMRVDPTFHKDQLVYYEKYNFKYNPEKSNGSPYDQVLVPNIVVLTAVSTAISARPFVALAIASALSYSDHKEAFLRLPVNRFLWGYEDSFFKTMKFLSPHDKSPEKFGILVYKVADYKELMTINTGEVNPDRTGILERWNGEAQAATAECNSLYSTDGFTFPPSMLDKQQTLYVFYPELARRLPFRYSGDVQLADGTTLLRYSIPATVFGQTANECYCGTDCPLSGLIQVNNHTVGFPALASLPHFFNGDPRLMSEVTGMKPNENDNVNYIDIHPTLGITLRENLRIQLNVKLEPKSTFKAVSNFTRGMVLPVAWFEKSVEEIPESLQTWIRARRERENLRVGLTVFGAAAFVVSAAFFLVLMFRKRP